MKLVFKLTIPNVGSWNGKWSGEGNLYAKTRNLGKSKNAEQKGKNLDGKTFHYSWNDGWGANVNVEIINAAEGNKIRAESKGFCGYDWMIDSIINYGEIRIP